MATGEGDVVFGRYRIDLTESRLYCGSDFVELRPKAWELLVLLASRPNALFSFDEINARLWADVIVAPHALTKLVSDLRRALGADGAAHIENVPRRGYRLLAQAAVQPANAPSTVAGPPLFVARESELAQLDRHWQSALGGQRQFVFVGGEAGIGKTALVDRFLGGLASAPALIARGQCVPLLGEPAPYGPIVEALQRIALQGSVLERLRHYAPAWLLQLRGLISAEESKELLALVVGSGAQRMLNEAAVLLEAIAAETPLAVVLEDAHWADGATIDLLRALMQRGERTRLLVIVSYRPAEVALGRHPLHSVVQLAGRISGCPRIGLAGLSQDEIGQFVRRRFGADADANLVALLERATGGNALFLGLMTEHLIERGWLDGSNGCWLRPAPEEAADLGVPASLREMIELEIASAAKENIEVLEAAALVGDRFTAEIAGAAAQRPAETVDQLAHELARARQIVRFDADAEPPAYEFVHALYRQVLVERVAPARARSLHQRIGEHLEAAAADLIERAPQLAHHFGAAGDRRRRADYLELSAKKAAQRLAFREARETLAQAIEAIRELPPAPERANREADRLLDLANQSAIGGYTYDNDGARDAYDRARQLAEEGGDARIAFRAQLGRCLMHVIGGSDEAVNIAKDLVRTAEQGNGELAAVAHTYATMTYYFRADCELALEHSRAGLEMLPHAAPGVPAIYDLTIRLHTLRASVLELMGRADEALAEHRLALARAQERGSALEKLELILWRAPSCALKDDVPAVLAATDLGIEITARHGLPMWVDTLNFYRVWARVRCDEVEVDQLESALAAESLQRNPMARELMPVLLAKECLRRGDLGAARRQLEASEIRACLYVEAERWRVIGQLLIDERRAKKRASRARDPLGAGLSGEECLRRALEIARRQGAALLEPRAQSALDAAT